MRKIVYYLTHPIQTVATVLCRFGSFLPDKMFLKMQFRAIMDKRLDLKNPKTFNEKLQWLKLYNRKPEYTIMVDKYLAKKYVADKIGEEYIIPTLGVWDSADEIDFDRLPEQFVLKCNHNSGGLVICKDKSKLNITEAKKRLSCALREDFYMMGREWPYKNVPRKIIAEMFMSDASQGNDLRDYKFYCFNGEPKFCQVIADRNEKETVDFFDMDWHHQEFTGMALPHKPFSKSPILAPINFEKMKKSANVLADNIPFLRVDFYEINGKMYFGELTFFPATGFGSFSPDEWNERLGSWIKL